MSHWKNRQNFCHFLSKRQGYHFVINMRNIYVVKDALSKESSPKFPSIYYQANLSELINLTNLYSPEIFQGG